MYVLALTHSVLVFLQNVHATQREQRVELNVPTLQQGNADASQELMVIIVTDVKMDIMGLETILPMVAKVEFLFQYA